MDDRRMRIIEAGDWLKEQRERRNLTVRDLATKIDVTTQMVYDWQNGKNAVSDERADDIAGVLEMDIIEVRRGLGLWVPPDHHEVKPPTLQDYSTQDLFRELDRRFSEGEAADGKAIGT